jgi:hypothetical protein
MANDLVTTIARKMGAIVLPDNSQWQNRIEIKSGSSSRIYVVAQRKSDGSWGCSCPGWKAHRHCKHLRAMGPALKTIGGQINGAR